MNEMKVLCESEEMQVSGGIIPAFIVAVRVAIAIAKNPKVQKFVGKMIVGAAAGYEAGDFTVERLGWRNKP